MIIEDIRIEDLTADYRAAVLDPAVRANVLSGAKEWGFFVLTDYMSDSDCDALVALIDDTIAHRPEIVRSAQDKRILGADVLDERIEAFSTDPLFEEVGEHVCGEQQKCLFAMANRVEYVDGVSARSGERWHRDRIAPQFKSMVYLSDVTQDNGPFCLLPKSNAIWPHARFCKDTEMDFVATRWDDETFAPFIEKAQDYLKVFAAKKGTVVLFNSSNIHSGQPIRAGRRYAITNYFYAKTDINIKKMSQKWPTIARPLSMPEFRAR